MRPCRQSEQVYAANTGAPALLDTRSSSSGSSSSNSSSSDGSSGSGCNAAEAVAVPATGYIQTLVNRVVGVADFVQCRMAAHIAPVLPQQTAAGAAGAAAAACPTQMPYSEIKE